jgi:tetratricopeptide (TPR) repeat protein
MTWPLETKRSGLGYWSSRPASGIANLGDALVAQGKYAEAGPFLRESLGVKRRVLGEGHRQAALGAVKLAEALRRLGRLDEVRLLLAGVLRERGRLGEAEALAREVHARHAGDPPNDPRHLRAVRELAATLTALGRTSEADPLHRQAARESEAALRPGHPDIADAWAGLAENALAAGDPPEAVELLERALAVRRAALPEGHWLVAETTATLGRALVAEERSR